MVRKARENFFTLLYPEPKNMCENQHFATKYLNDSAFLTMQLS